MAVSKIPTSQTLSNYIMRVDLDGVFFKLRFRFNERDSAWYCDVLSDSDAPLRMGMRIVNEWPLLRTWRSSTRPAGSLVTVNQGDISGPPGLNQLGRDVVLTYLDQDEIDAASNG